MIRLRHKALIHSFVVLDQAMLCAVAVAIIYLRPEVHFSGDSSPAQATFQVRDIAGLILLVSGWWAIFHYCVSYKADRFTALSRQLRDLLKATTLATFLLVVISALFSIRSFNLANVVLFWIGVTGVGIGSRLLIRSLLMRARRSGYNYRYLLMIGTNSHAYSVAARIESRLELGYKLVGFVTEEGLPDAPVELSKHGQVLGKLEDLQAILKQERVDEVLVCLPVEARFSDIIKIVRHAQDLGVVVRVMPHLDGESLLKNFQVEQFDGEYVLTLFREQMLLQLAVKRLVDISVSLVALLVLAPLMVLVAVLIKLTSPGPVFFVQNRVGMNQRLFRFYKFRSMVEDAEARREDMAHLNEVDGPVFKVAADPRVTRIGRFIRKFSIDEVPQLFNVLRGEMSLVGPRPPLPEEVKQYEWLFRKRLSVKPGITCIWQVNGRNNTSFERWMQMDHAYIENWSLWLDLKILLQTIPAVLFCRGAS